MQPDALAKTVGADVLHHIGHDFADDPGCQPADQKDKCDRQQVGQIPQQFVNDNTNRAQQPAKLEGAENGRQENEKRQPINRFARGVRKRHCLAAFQFGVFFNAFLKPGG